MMNEGLVSIIIPVFNRPTMLREAVKCALDESYPSIEITIVDDGSTDETPCVADELAAKYPEKIRAIHQPNSGPGLAREAGRQVARGDFIQYLDSDDWIDPRKLERQVAALRDHPEAGVAYCKTRERWPGEPVEDTASFRTGERMETLFPALLSGRCWQTITPLIRRAVSDRVGPWTGLRQEEDWEYDARIAALGIRLVWCDEFLAEHRHHSGERAGGKSQGDARKMRWRAEAHRLIYAHAQRAGFGSDDPNMQRFARELFLLSRQCGAAGLAGESRLLFDLAREASGRPRSRGWDFRAYRGVAAVVGWSTAGRLACWGDRLRRA